MLCEAGAERRRGLAHSHYHRCLWGKMLSLPFVWRTEWASSLIMICIQQTFPPADTELRRTAQTLGFTVDSSALMLFLFGFSQGVFTHISQVSVLTLIGFSCREKMARLKDVEKAGNPRLSWGMPCSGATKACRGKWL